MKPAIKYSPSTITVPTSTNKQTISFDRPTSGEKRLAGFVLNAVDTTVFRTANFGLRIGTTELIPEDAPAKNVVVENPCSPNEQVFKFKHYVPADDRLTATYQHVTAPGSEYQLTLTLIYTDEEPQGKEWQLAPSIL